MDWALYKKLSIMRTAARITNYTDAFCSLDMSDLVNENTAHTRASTAMLLPTQAVLETEPVWFNTNPPVADPSEMPICNAELLKLCWIAELAGSISIR